MVLNRLNTAITSCDFYNALNSYTIQRITPYNKGTFTAATLVKKYIRSKILDGGSEISFYSRTPSIPSEKLELSKEAVKDESSFESQDELIEYLEEFDRPPKSNRNKLATDIVEAALQFIVGEQFAGTRIKFNNFKKVYNRYSATVSNNDRAIEIVLKLIRCINTLFDTLFTEMFDIDQQNKTSLSECQRKHDSRMEALRLFTIALYEPLLNRDDVSETSMIGSNGVIIENTFARKLFDIYSNSDLTLIERVSELYALFLSNPQSRDDYVKRIKDMYTGMFSPSPSEIEEYWLEPKTIPFIGLNLYFECLLHPQVLLHNINPDGEDISFEKRIFDSVATQMKDAVEKSVNGRYYIIRNQSYISVSDGISSIGTKRKGSGKKDVCYAYYDLSSITRDLWDSVLDSRFQKRDLATTKSSSSISQNAIEALFDTTQSDGFEQFSKKDLWKGEQYDTITLPTGEVADKDEFFYDITEVYNRDGFLKEDKKHGKLPRLLTIPILITVPLKDQTEWQDDELTYTFQEVLTAKGTVTYCLLTSHRHISLYVDEPDDFTDGSTRKFTCICTHMDYCLSGVPTAPPDVMVKLTVMEKINHIINSVLYPKYIYDDLTNEETCITEFPYYKEMISNAVSKNIIEKYAVSTETATDTDISKLNRSYINTDSKDVYEYDTESNTLLHHGRLCDFMDTDRKEPQRTSLPIPEVKEIKIDNVMYKYISNLACDTPKKRKLKELKNTTTSRDAEAARYNIVLYRDNNEILVHSKNKLRCTHTVGLTETVYNIRPVFNLNLVEKTKLEVNNDIERTIMTMKTKDDTSDASSITKDLVASTSKSQPKPEPKSTPKPAQSKPVPQPQQLWLEPSVNLKDCKLEKIPGDNLIPEILDEQQDTLNQTPFSEVDKLIESNEPETEEIKEITELFDARTGLKILNEVRSNNDLVYTKQQLQQLIQSHTKQKITKKSKKNKKSVPNWSPQQKEPALPQLTSEYIDNLMLDYSTVELDEEYKGLQPYDPAKDFFDYLGE